MVMQVFNRHTLKSLFVSTLFVTITLSMVIMLTQSLRFLELIIQSGADIGSFWTLSFLAIPRFLEILMPLSAMIATMFIYNRMIDNSELVILRTTGFSPLYIVKPALVLASGITLFLWFVTLWAAPKSLSTLQLMRQTIKSQFSVSLLHDGVFNRIGKDLTVYIQDKENDGVLNGLVIYDKSNRETLPSTVLAKRGVLAETPDGYQVIVYDGSRQQYDPETQILHKLDFERYTLDLPLSEDIRKRWREPDERTIFELLNPNMDVKRDVESLIEFKIEIHRRIAAPLLTFAFILLAATALVLGPVGRNGQCARLGFIALAVLTLQGGFIACVNLAKQTDFGLYLTYIIVLLPILGCFYLLSGYGEQWRRHLLYGNKSGELDR